VANTNVQKTAETPTVNPPEEVDLTTIEAEPARPRELSDAELVITAPRVADEPTLAPPEIRAAEAGEGIAAWQSDKRIGALWTINQVRNSWLFVNGVGWRKIVNNSDSATVAMSMISAHAKYLGTRVDYREEADGMVYEIYAW
jgi:hypothetical protein